MKKLLITIVAIYFSITITRNIYSYDESVLSPLKIKNQYVFYLPYLFIPNESVFKKEQEIKIDIYKSNTYIDYIAMKNKGIIDLETTTVSIDYSYSFSDIKITISLPFIYHGGGYLDPIIEGFHNSFSLPNGGRNIWYDNRIYIWFEEKNLLIKDKIYGISNPSIFLSSKIISINPYIIFTIGLKPGIISKSIISTSSWDIGSFLSFKYFGQDWFLYSGIGIVNMIGEDFYKRNFHREKDFIFNLNIGGGLKIYENISFITGVYLQTSPYDTGIKRIDRVSIINSYGLRILLSKEVLFQFNIDEDSFTFAGTDINFHISFEINI